MKHDFYKSKLISRIQQEIGREGQNPNVVEYLKGKLNFFEASWEGKITLSLNNYDDRFLLDTLNILVSGSFAGNSRPTGVMGLIALPEKINDMVFSHLSDYIFKFEVADAALLPPLKYLLNEYGVCTFSHKSITLYLGKCYEIKSFIEYIKSLDITFLE
jgi:hypothetical protein